MPYGCKRRGDGIVNGVDTGDLRNTSELIVAGQVGIKATVNNAETNKQNNRIGIRRKGRR